MPHRQNDSLPAGNATPAGLEIHPVTLERCDDLVVLFETSPVMSSCWCMSPRLRASDFRDLGSSEVGVAGKNRGQPRLVMRYDLLRPLSSFYARLQDR
jgi:hypothetical protein